jgi:hypothetical protein
MLGHVASWGDRSQAHQSHEDLKVPMPRQIILRFPLLAVLASLVGIVSHVITVTVFRQHFAVAFISLDP